MYNLFCTLLLSVTVLFCFISAVVEKAEAFCNCFKLVIIYLKNGINKNALLQGIFCLV